jgi:hypothetical protein
MTSLLLVSAACCIQLLVVVFAKLNSGSVFFEKKIQVQVKSEMMLNSG